MSDDTTRRRDLFQEAVPGGFFVDADAPRELERHLRRTGLVGADETIDSVAKGGEGNMNLTLRVATSTRSVILKQARPWVEKYPQIPAPADRALVEIAFYEAVSAVPEMREAMPRLLGADTDSRLLLLEDLGEAQDYTSVYTEGQLGRQDLQGLVRYLTALHAAEGPNHAEGRALFQNRDMRALNHEHIFRLPLVQENGLDLDGITPGLGAVAQRLKDDTAYVSKVTALGDDYLADGETLVHGDYFPGSWLRTPGGVRVIDPEFCFLGSPAFDVGFMLGHLHLARQSEEVAESLLSLYGGEAGAGGAIAETARRVAGVEIMRRLIGVAQLPVGYGIDEKERLLRLSRDLVMAG